jgi:PqqD family protein of HPr-rel-A system
LTRPDVSTRWSCPFFDSLLRETWETEYFVLNPCSGETHVLSQLAGEILSALGETPSTLRDLVGSFGPALEAASNTPPERILASLLAQLDQLGLIEPIAAQRSSRAPDRDEGC